MRFDAAHLSINLVLEIAVPMFPTLREMKNSTSQEDRQDSPKIKRDGSIITYPRPFDYYSDTVNLAANLFA